MNKKRQDNAVIKAVFVCMMLMTALGVIAFMCAVFGAGFNKKDLSKNTQKNTNQQQAQDAKNSESQKPDTQEVTQKNDSQKDDSQKDDSQKDEKNKKNSKYVVVLDAGHQLHGNSKLEPNGPGSSEMKKKVSSGAEGDYTKTPEYELNLAVALRVQKILEDKGYTVIMTRTKNEVNISNVERAEIANKAKADAFVRIHADSVENHSKKGAMTICQTKDSPYNAKIYKECRKLSECVLDEFVEATGAKKNQIWETNTMTGTNWSEVPTTIIEMGYMSNKEEDELMDTEAYRDKMAKGIANGIIKYLNEK